MHTKHRSPLGILVRGPDAWARSGGGWGAARTSKGRPRKHEGIDILTVVGQPIVAPVRAYFLRVADPYIDKRDKKLLGAVLVAGDNTKLKFLYIDPLEGKVGKTLEEGEVFGYAQSLQHLYPGIQEHLHLEVRDHEGRRINPMTYFQRFA